MQDSKFLCNEKSHTSWVQRKFTFSRCKISKNRGREGEREAPPAASSQPFFYMFARTAGAMYNTHIAQSRYTYLSSIWIKLPDTNICKMALI